MMGCCICGCCAMTLGVGGTSISSSCLRAISISSLADLAPSWLPDVVLDDEDTVTSGDMAAAGLDAAADCSADATAFLLRGSCGREASSTTNSSLVGVPGDLDTPATEPTTDVGTPAVPGGGESPMPGGGGVALVPSASDSGVASPAK